ncbi:MAG: fumarate/nitrate reduction transcriptional regulator Fnr [Gammaproteobacteria bacterium]|nr:fumarate/nitrate reduction transcriptional regulator Fnr [Gammaproteobacteria bacterium]
MTETNVSFRALSDSCKTCSLAELCLPRGLQAEELQRLDDVIKARRVVHSGDLLFKEGSDNRSIYAVRSGSVKTFVITESGEEQVLGFHLPGEIVGLAGLDQSIHNCSSKALETSSICEMPLDELEDICLQIPSLQKQLLKLISREISQDHKMLLLLAKKNSDQRVATFLLSLSGRFKLRGLSSDSFILSMSRQDIANYLGLAVETVSRILTKLSEDEIVDVTRRSIEIVDHNRLLEIASS